MYWQEERKRGRVLGRVRGPKMGHLTLGKRTARTGIHNYIQGATIPSKGFFFYINKLQNLMQRYNVYVQYIVKRKYSFLHRLKINRVTEDRDMHLFLAQWSVQLQT
jgi:hypothetical protein